MTTLMMPLIMLLAAGISYYSSVSVSKEEQQVAIIDETGEFFPYLESKLATSPVKVTLHEPAQREQLATQVEERELNGYLIITAETVSYTHLDVYKRQPQNMAS